MFAECMNGGFWEISGYCSKGMEGRTKAFTEGLTQQKDGFSSKNFVLHGQANNSALLLRKDVRSTMFGLKHLNPFTSAMLHKNRFALYILSFPHYITTLVHAMRLRVVNIRMLNGKHADIWTATSSVIDERHYFVAQCDGTDYHLTPCEQSECFRKAKNHNRLT